MKSTRYYLMLCLLIVSHSIFALDTKLNYPSTQYVSGFIKARSFPPLALSPKVLDTIKKFEVNHHINNVGSKILFKISEKDALNLGYLRMKGQSVRDLVNYPELVKYMTDNHMEFLPDSRLDVSDLFNKK